MAVPPLYTTQASTTTSGSVDDYADSIPQSGGHHPLDEVPGSTCPDVDEDVLCSAAKPNLVGSLDFDQEVGHLGVEVVQVGHA